MMLPLASNIRLNNHFVGRLAGEDREMDCPICRRRLAVPDQGFPVCVLTERIKDELEIAKENAAGAEEDAAHAEGKNTDKSCTAVIDEALISMMNSITAVKIEIGKEINIYCCLCNCCRLM